MKRSSLISSASQGRGSRCDAGSRLPQHGCLTWGGQLMPPKSAFETLGKARQRPARILGLGAGDAHDEPERHRASGQLDREQRTQQQVFGEKPRYVGVVSLGFALLSDEPENRRRGGDSNDDRAFLDDVVDRLRAAAAEAFRTR